MWRADRRGYVTFVSRVVEKSGLFTTLILQELVKHLEATGWTEGVKELILWSDAGPHYRCWRFFTGACIKFTAIAKCHVAIKVGLEHHLKDECDRYFSLLNRRLSAAETKVQIDSLATLLEVWRAAAGVHYGDDLASEEFIDFLPTLARWKYAEEVGQLHRTTTFVTGIMNSHYFTFRIADFRRLPPRSFIATDGITITGIRAASHLLPTFFNPLAMTSVFPRLFTGRDREAEAVGEEEPPVAEVEGAEEEFVQLDKSSLVAMTTKFHEGWRLSYREKMPEQPNRELTLARLKAKNKSYEGLTLPPARRGRLPQPKAIEAAMLDRKQKRKRAEAEVFAALRKLPVPVVPPPAAEAMPPVVLGVPDPSVLDLFM